MKINRRSLHYRFFRAMLWLSIWRRCNDPKSLCSYFWAVLLSPIAPPITAICLLGWAVLTATIVTAPVWVFYAWPHAEEGVEFVGLALLFAIGVIVDVALIIVAGDWALKRIPMDHMPRLSSSDMVHVAGEYIKAKKERICPIIQYED